MLLSIRDKIFLSSQQRDEAAAEWDSNKELWIVITSASVQELLYLWLGPVLYRNLASKSLLRQELFFILILFSAASA